MTSRVGSVLGIVLAVGMLSACGDGEDDPAEALPDALRAIVADWFAQSHRGNQWYDVRANSFNSRPVECDDGEQFRYEITARTTTYENSDLDERFDLISTQLTGTRPFDEAFEFVSRSDSDAAQGRSQVYRSEDDGVTVAVELEPAEDGAIAATFRGETDCE